MKGGRTVKENSYRALKLDIDKKRLPLKQIKKRLKFIEWLFEYHFTKMYIWKTKHGYHLLVESQNEIPPSDIPILQMALLSDWRRELFNHFRVKNGIKNFNVLFYTKEKFKKVIYL
jgi:hypothetical protein